MGYKTRPHDDDALSELNVTPLADMMLVLVIIFLVTTPLLTQSTNVALPQSNSPPSEQDKQALQLGIDAEGLITLNQNPIADLAALETSLQSELAADPDVSIHVWADNRVRYEKVVKALTTVQHAGIAKLAFVNMEE